MPHRLANGDFELAFDETVGGLLGAATWRGLDILHTRPGNSVLDAGCFPLVPFSNRIAGSRFSFGGRDVALKPNHPGDPASPVIHGFGWLSEWTVEQLAETRATLGFRYEGGAWPWPFEARQDISVHGNGFDLELALRNLGEDPMPAGLGFHPYFPRNDRTLFKSLHKGEWETDDAMIPTRVEEHLAPVDWWEGKPVATRNVDTVYTGREGPLLVEWPDREMGVRIEPSPDLAFTTVYVPADEDYFCVEPVSHMTDAFNRHGQDSGAGVLAAGEEWSVAMRVEVYAL